MNNMSINDFKFELLGHGCYKVTYVSSKTNKSWSTLITDMTIIDATKNEECPKVKDLNYLKKICKTK